MARAAEYSHFTPQTIPPVSNLQDKNPYIDDVISSFKKIRSRGDYLGCWDNEQIKWPRYTQTAQNQFGFNNHLQSMQRLRKGKYAVISGGDPHESMAHLFVIEMSSRNAIGGWRSNVLETSKPPDEDRIVTTIAIDEKKWHAGGISALGDILAVPIYSTKPVNSEIVFYHMANPKAPGKFEHNISRPGVQSYAVALTKLPNGYFLLATWGGDKAQDPPRPRCLDFYLSKSTNFNEGFIRTKRTWYPENVQAVEDQDRNFGDFQSINFITQTSGEIFLVGMHNNSDLSPHKPGTDYADLYHITFDTDLALTSSPQLSEPTVTKVANKKFYCLDQQCHFDASSGIHIDRSNILRLYSSYYWSDNALINFNEYRPEIDSLNEQVTQARNGWVELFEYANYGGRVLSLVGERGTDLNDYRRISVQGRAFNDVVSSARFHLPEGTIYRLYKSRNFKENGGYLDLAGTGEVREIQDFDTINLNGTRFENGISSSKFV